MIFLDTSILLYSISTAADEESKRDKTIALLERDDCALSVQVLQEFYVQATRASRPDPLPHDIAAGLIKTWLRFKVQENTISVLEDALESKRHTDFPFGTAPSSPRPALSDAAKSILKTSHTAARWKASGLSIRFDEDE